MKELIGCIGLVRLFSVSYYRIQESPQDLENTPVPDLKNILEECESVVKFNQQLMNKFSKHIPQELYKYSSNIGLLIFNCKDPEVITKIEEVNLSGTKIYRRKIEKLSDYIKNRPGSDT